MPSLLIVSDDLRLWYSRDNADRIGALDRLPAHGAATQDGLRVCLTDREG